MAFAERTGIMGRDPGPGSADPGRKSPGRLGRTRMARVEFREDRCKGCGLCVEVCPKHIVAMRCDVLNAKGFHPAGVEEMDKCIGCAFCAIMCPDEVIQVEK